MKPLVIADGYNIIGAWREAKKKRYTIDEARDQLIHMFSEYCNYKDVEGVLVFDGYRTNRTSTTVEEKPPLTVVYTRHGETADSYIERLAVRTPRYRAIRVATSDGAVQNMALGAGATRITSRELLFEMENAHQTGYVAYQQQQPLVHNLLFDRLPADVLEKLERIRRSE